MKKEDTSKIWDKVWDGDSEEADKFYLERTRKSVEWRELKKQILETFGTFKNLKVINVGSGRGTYPLLFARGGADVTLLDYSKGAIERSKKFFKKYGQKANFIHKSVFDIEKKMFGNFDIVMSYGVAEYFNGKDREKFVKINFDLAKNNGIIIISVPNKRNPPYRLWKFLSEKLGRWQFDKEYFFSKSEFLDIGKRFNAKVNFIGSYFFDTHFNIKKRIMKKFGRSEWDLKNIGKQFRTPLDKHLSKTLIVVYKKKEQYR